MSAKLASPPPVAPETWRALFDAAVAFAALKPWKTIYDSDVVGLTDPVTGETRIGCVLGNAGQVFGAVFYRRPAGLRWILSILNEAPDEPDLAGAEGIDCLKLEFVPKPELRKEDLAVLKAAGFKPAGRGSVWPQFRSAEPGWHPWFINQAEAEQFLADLPRLTAFCAVLRAQPDLFAGRAPGEIPFLPSPLPERPLLPEDLNWQPLIPPPASDLSPFQATDEQIAQLRALHPVPGASYEYECMLLPGGSFLENGRPCYGRCSFLVEHRRGLVLGFDVSSGVAAPGESAGRGLVKALLENGFLPGKLLIRGARLEPVLAPLCAKVGIQLKPAARLPALEEAAASISQHMLAGQ
jgi:hypothetical protein